MMNALLVLEAPVVVLNQGPFLLEDLWVLELPLSELPQGLVEKPLFEFASAVVLFELVVEEDASVLLLLKLGLLEVVEVVGWSSWSSRW